MSLYHRAKWIAVDFYYRVKYKLQLWFRGYSDAEIISLDTALARWILPRLRAFRDAQGGCPWSVVKQAFGLRGLSINDSCEMRSDIDEAWKASNELWQEKLTAMIKGFEEVLEDIEGNREGDERRIQTALTLLAEHYRSLWL